MGLLRSDSVPPAARPGQRIVFSLAAAGLTLLLVWLALWLGGWAFETRKLRLHEERLERLLAKEPALEGVVGALREEGAVALAAPSDPAQLRQLAARAGPKAPEVMEKARRWPQVRVFLLDGDVLYFLFFDGGGVLRAFTFARA